MGTIQVKDKNEGTKIAYEQQGTKIFFGDDEIMLNVPKYQRDWPVEVDIMADTNHNLTIGDGIYYVAQISIPAIQYRMLEVDPEAPEGTPTMEAIPLDMADVVLTLWAIDDLALI